MNKDDQGTVGAAYEFYLNQERRFGLLTFLGRRKRARRVPTTLHSSEPRRDDFVTTGLAIVSMKSED